MVNILKGETAALSLWLNTSMFYYRANKPDDFKAVLEEVGGARPATTTSTTPDEKLAVFSPPSPLPSLLRDISPTSPQRDPTVA